MNSENPYQAEHATTTTPHETKVADHGQKQYHNLQENYDEMHEYLLQLIEKHEHTLEKLV